MRVREIGIPLYLFFFFLFFSFTWQSDCLSVCLFVCFFACLSRSEELIYREFYHFKVIL